MSLFSHVTGALRAQRDRYRRKARKAHLALLQARGMKVGEDCFFEDGAFFDPSHCYLIEIGDQVIFAPNVRLIAHDASTKYVVGKARLGRIRIGSRCFLGDSVIVLAGASIGDDCIIGAGSLVSRQIPAGSVAAGNPARVICTIEEYRAKHRAALESGRLFDESAAAENADAQTREAVLRALDRGSAYMP